MREMPVTVFDWPCSALSAAAIHARTQPVAGALQSERRFSSRDREQGVVMCEMLASLWQRVFARVLSCLSHFS